MMTAAERKALEKKYIDPLQSATVDMLKYVARHVHGKIMVIGDDQAINRVLGSMAIGWVCLAVGDVEFVDPGYKGEVTAWFTVRTIVDDNKVDAKFVPVDDTHVEIKVNVPNERDEHTAAYYAALGVVSNDAKRMLSQKLGMEVR